MATRTWGGATSGAVDVAGNYVAGVAPTAGDSVIWDRAAVNNMESGTFPALVDFTISAGSGASLLGTASSQPTFGAVTGTLRIGGLGAYYKISSTGTVALLKAELSAASIVYAVAGTFTQCDLTSGRFQSEAAAVLGTINSNGTSGEVGTNATAITALAGYGDWRITLRNITLVEFYGPTARLTTKGTTTGSGASSGSVVTGKFAAGAIYNKQSAADDTTAHLIGPRSTLTVAGNQNPNAGTLATLNRWVDTILIKTVPGSTLTVTTTNTIGASGASGAGQAGNDY